MKQARVNQLKQPKHQIPPQHMLPIHKAYHPRRQRRYRLMHLFARNNIFSKRLGQPNDEGRNSQKNSRIRSHGKTTEGTSKWWQVACSSMTAPQSRKTTSTSYKVATRKLCYDRYSHPWLLAIYEKWPAMQNMYFPEQKITLLYFVVNWSNTYWFHWPHL